MGSAKEMAKKWGVSKATVNKYCASGIIPMAEKVNRKWDIPDEWPKPPMTRHGLCFLMDTIFLINHGVNYQDLKFGYSEDIIKAGFKYLKNSGFITSININRLSKSLIKASVTMRGKELIDRENGESKGKYSFTAHVTAGVNSGVVKAGVNLEVTNRS